MRNARPASFYRYAQALPQRTAVIESDGRRITYGELHRQANRVSHALRASGVETGAKIAVLASNNAHFLALELGASQIGVRMVAVNTHLAQDEVTYILGNSESRLVFTEESFVHRVRAGLSALDRSADDLITIDAPGGPRSLDTFVAGRPEIEPAHRVHAMRSMYTSGTTGRPKGVVWPVDTSVTPEAGVAALDWIMEQRGMRHDPTAVNLISGPLHHGAPGSWALAGLHRGHTIALSGKWDSEQFLRLVEEYRVTVAQLAPIHFYRLLQLTSRVRASYDLSSLRIVSHAGSPTPVAVKRQMMDWLGPILWEYYGAAEGWGTTISPSDWLEHPGSAGRHDAEGARMKILDDSGRELPPGEPGTLWVRNPTGVNSEYLGDPERTAANRRGEYFTVGDIAYLDAEGWLYIVDRRTDLILSGAVNVYPAEVEDALRRHPAVADVAVIGMPDPEWHQRVHAVVVPAPGVAPTAALVDELRAFVGGRLARFKVPKQIEFRAALPYSQAGKLLRRELREQAGRPDGR
ncbi:AMP-binding protein [Streptomyces sp. NPDC096311]|uniref:AMP-binding protein n=1 Tax=Streptomyces sp. NPDC096311 TaxID=3366083 RepID=UPI00382023DC